MHEVGATLNEVFDAAPPDSLAALLQAAAARAGNMQLQAEEALAGSTHPLAEQLRGEIEDIVLGLGGLAAKVEAAGETSRALIEAWGAGQTEAPAPTDPLPVSERAEPAPARATEPDLTESWSRPDPFELTADPFDPRMQRKLNQPVDQVFSVDQVGFTSSHRILTTLATYGLRTVRDIFLVGRRVAFGSMGEKHRAALETKLRELCPGVPFNNYLTPESAARLTDSIHAVPIQAVHTMYRHSARRRVTVGETLDRDGNYNSQGPARFRERNAARQLEQYAKDFEEARRQLARPEQ